MLRFINTSSTEWGNFMLYKNILFSKDKPVMHRNFAMKGSYVVEAAFIFTK